MTQVMDQSISAQELILISEFPQVSSPLLFEHFTKPELLKLWWVPRAHIDLRVGGEYVFQWDKPDWVLRGNFTHIVPSRALGFTWHWDHEAMRPVRQVDIEFRPLPTGNGTILHLKHGIYQNVDFDVEDRKSHQEGWEHFLNQLHRVVNT